MQGCLDRRILGALDAILVCLHSVLSRIKYLRGRGRPHALVHKWLELLGLRTETNTLKPHPDDVPFEQMVSEKADRRTVGSAWLGSFQYSGISKQAIPSPLGSLDSHPQTGGIL